MFVFCLISYNLNSLNLYLKNLVFKKIPIPDIIGFDKLGWTPIILPPFIYDSSLNFEIPLLPILS